MNQTIPNDYIEKVYAGWLGKIIGVRHGSNVESWSYDKINRTFGEVTDYLFNFKNFAADDDTNGPIFFLRALDDYTHTSEITAEQMGLTWLNYVPDGHGFFWWGGYGKSTENTAYVNLKNGIMAPRSGSSSQNGSTVAEQIGGQIFIDVWGMIAPGNPKLAANYAEKMASVSHDGNGKYGGMFIAACIAQAFVETDIEQIIEAGLTVIPSDCEYTRMTRDVIRFYKENKEDWRKAFKFVFDHYGYDRYPGSCHIIPNSAVIVLSLLYSQGDFSKAINICNMCGWDTDCNVANVGSIMGVRGGLDGIEMKWRKPIDDFLCCSSVIGSLNMLDIPSCASYIAKFGYKIAGEAFPTKWEEILTAKEPYFHFEYPGSTHSFKTDYDDDNYATLDVTTHIENVMESENASRSLKVTFDRAMAGNGYRVYHQTYYTPEDFNDSRYDPSFSPKLYPGQTIKAKVGLGHIATNEVRARLFVKDRNSNMRFYGDTATIKKGDWVNLEFTIPFMNDACIIEAGIEWIPIQGWMAEQELIVFVDHMLFTGKPVYQIDFANERMEKWSALHLEVSQFSYLRGIWSLENDCLSGTYAGEPAECYTGSLDWNNVDFKATVIPQHGNNHNILFRVQGAIRSYAIGFAKDGKFSLYKNENGYRELISVDYEWKTDKEYEVRVVAIDNVFSIFINGEEILDYTDQQNPYLNGMVGFSNWGASRTHYKSFAVIGL